ncbi:hypothetical protein E2P86_08465 [Sphingobacterium psychroaquaticum]|uniref:hypothetical protein n=1 Tax=Sphingobacterium psychroaquaticum TaxID=561061 RepID=UPI00106B1613|nr:hypothetical protein [Sphingobacterium psychroaquaticum]QBQ41186.1 hypothetical protein E2P86_08465 [Sphingobacterium psychroaquaticum]
MITEDKLKALGFERYEWRDEDGDSIVDHKLKKGSVVIEITNMEKVEITTQGNYIELPKINKDSKLEQLINLLS